MNEPDVRDRHLPEILSKFLGVQARDGDAFRTGRNAVEANLGTTLNEAHETVMGTDPAFVARLLKIVDAANAHISGSNRMHGTNFDEISIRALEDRRPRSITVLKRTQADIDRNKFAYEQRAGKKKWKEIAREINGTKGWDPVNADSGVRNAANDHVKDNPDLPPLTKKASRKGSQ